MATTTSRPTDLPEWGTSLVSPSDIVEPPVQKQQRGWFFLEFPPFNFVNWFWNRTADWARHFAGTASKFPTLEASAAARTDLDAPIAIGDTCIVDEPDGAAPGAQVVPFILAGFSSNAVAVTSKSVVMTENNDEAGIAVERDGSSTVVFPIQTYMLTNPIGTGVIALLSDGVDVIIAHDDDIVECFDHDTGVSKWTGGAAVGQTITDLAWDSKHVYTTTDGAAGPELQANDRTNGVSVWTYDHSGVASAPLQSVATNGRLVFVAGAASGHASGATLRGIDALTGADALNEGGNGISLIAWDQVQGTPTTKPRLLVTDGRYIFVGSASDIQRRSAASGTTDGTNVGTPEVVIALDVDNELVVAAWWDEDLTPPNHGGASAYTKDLVEAWRNDEVDASNQRTRDIATDGAAIFLIGDTEASNFANPRLARGNQPGVWKQVDPGLGGDDFLTMRQLVVPSR